MIRDLVQGLAFGGLLMLVGVSPLVKQGFAFAALPDQFATVDDALEHAEPVVEVSTEAEPIEAAPETGVLLEDEPLGPPLPVFIRLDGGTTVKSVWFYSPVLEREISYRVILPPDYEQGLKRYPVMYMLHGAAGGADEWLGIGLHSAADELWREGWDSFIIVLPEGNTFSYWINHANGGPRYNDYLVEDVVREVDAAYRTLPQPAFRAVGGLSMGGDAALRLGLTYPNLFGVVGAHSPTTRRGYDQRPGDIYGDETYWEYNNPLWLIRNTETAGQLSIWIDIGQDDVWLPSAQALREALEEQGVEPEYFEREGTHEAEYWIANQLDYLRYYARAFGPTLQALESGASQVESASPDER